MPTYDVTDPLTGMSLSLTGDSPPTEQELEGIFAEQAPRYRQRLQQQLQQQLGESRRLSEDLTPGAIETAVRGFAQGTTLGLGEEVGAAVSALPAALDDDETITQRYKRLRDEQRAQNRLARQARPGTFLAGELAGGLTTGIASAPLIGGGALAQSIPRLAGVGAVEGGLAGLGYSEAQTLPETGVDVAVGAGTGAALGAAIPALGAGIGRAGRNIRQRFSPQTRAARQIMADLDADSLTISQAQQQLTDNPDLVLADLGENLQQRLGAIANQPGTAAQRARELLEKRNIDQLERLTPKFEKALGGTGVLEAQKASVARVRQAAAPLYDEAYATDLPISETLQELFQRPAAKAAMTKARRLAADEGVNIVTDEPNVQMIDYLQRALRDNVDAVKFKAPNKARIIGRLRDDIVAETDNLLEQQGTTAWRDARAIAAHEFDNRDALELGGKVFREKTPNLRDSYTNMAESEKAHFRIGVFDALMDRLGTKVETANLVQDFKKPKIREALRIAFDSPELFNEFTQVIGDEQRMFETMRKALQGSPTAGRMAFAPGAASIGEAAADITMGPGMGSVMQQAGRRVFGGIGDMFAGGRARQTGEAAGDLLLGRTPEQTLTTLANPPRVPAQVGTALPATSLPATEQLLQLMNGG